MYDFDFPSGYWSGGCGRREIAGRDRLRRRVRHPFEVAAGLQFDGRFGQVSHAVRAKYEHRAGPGDGQIQQTPADHPEQPREYPEGDQG